MITKLLTYSSQFKFGSNSIADCQETSTTPAQPASVDQFSRSTLKFSGSSADPFTGALIRRLIGQPPTRKVPAVEALEEKHLNEIRSTVKRGLVDGLATTDPKTIREMQQTLKDLAGDDPEMQRRYSLAAQAYIRHQGKVSHPDYGTEALDDLSHNLEALVKIPGMATKLPVQRKIKRTKNVSDSRLVVGKPTLDTSQLQTAPVVSASQSTPGQPSIVRSTVNALLPDYLRQVAPAVEQAGLIGQSATPAVGKAKQSVVRTPLPASPTPKNPAASAKINADQTQLGKSELEELTSLNSALPAAISAALAVTTPYSGRLKEIPKLEIGPVKIAQEMIQRSINSPSDLTIVKRYIARVTNTLLPESNQSLNVQAVSNNQSALTRQTRTQLDNLKRAQEKLALAAESGIPTQAPLDKSTLEQRLKVFAPGLSEVIYAALQRTTARNGKVTGMPTEEKELVKRAHQEIEKAVTNFEQLSLVKSYITACTQELLNGRGSKKGSGSAIQQLVEGSDLEATNTSHQIISNNRSAILGSLRTKFKKPKEQEELVLEAGSAMPSAPVTPAVADSATYGFLSINKPRATITGSTLQSDSSKSVAAEPSPIKEKTSPAATSPMQEDSAPATSQAPPRRLSQLFTPTPPDARSQVGAVFPDRMEIDNDSDSEPVRRSDNRAAASSSERKSRMVNLKITEAKNKESLRNILQGEPWYQYLTKRPQAARTIAALNYIRSRPAIENTVTEGTPLLDEREKTLSYVSDESKTIVESHFRTHGQAIAYQAEQYAKGDKTKMRAFYRALGLVMDRDFGGSNPGLSQPVKRAYRQYYKDFFNPDKYVSPSHSPALSASPSTVSLASSIGKQSYQEGSETNSVSGHRDRQSNIPQTASPNRLGFLSRTSSKDASQPQVLTAALLEAQQKQVTQEIPDFRVTMEIDSPVPGSETGTLPRISGESARPLKPIGVGESPSKASSLLGTKRPASSLGSFISSFDKLNFPKFRFTLGQKALTEDKLKNLPEGDLNRAGWERIDGKIARELERTQSNANISLNSSQLTSIATDDSVLPREEITADKTAGVRTGWRGLANSLKARNERRRAKQQKRARQE